MKITSHIEAILLAHGESIAVKKLAKILKEKEEVVQESVENLAKQYLEEERGFAILESSGDYQLVSNPESAEYIKKLVKQEESTLLSPAALEVLSIVAYRGPISRLEVDTIRGVNSSHILRLLSVRGLVDRKEDGEDSRLYRYRVSFDCMRQLGLQSINSLPEYANLSRDDAKI